MRREALIHKLKKVQMNVNDLTQTLPCSQDVFKAYQVNYSRELENSDDLIGFEHDLTQTLPCSQDVFKAYQVNYSRELENSDEKLTKIPVPTSNSGTVSNTRSTPNINI